jgi:transposase InsO family protein
MDNEIKKRWTWIKLNEETGDAGLVCRRCGISRPTLRKWWQRYQEQGEAGLRSQSRRPERSPNRKVFEQETEWILELRRTRHLGARRIQNELKRLHNCDLGLATIQKVLQQHQVSPLKRKRRQQRYRRYQRPVPGDRVQMDTCKIAPGLYQYTAVDDCSRFLVVALYPRRKAAHTLDFIDRVIEQMPFPIQRFQTDNGREFTAYKVQDLLLEWGIKFRPIRPAAPHLNGKVERVQKTVLDEFYPTVDLHDVALPDELETWQFYYNWQRMHGSLGKIPIERCTELAAKTPFTREVCEAFDENREREIHRQRAIRKGPMN